MSLVPDSFVQDFRAFQLHHVKQMGRALPAEMWHYTDAAGLVGILETGTIHFTQIACLNDALEYRYFGDLTLEEVRKRHLKNLDPKLAALFEMAIDLLSTNRDFSAVGHFVSCFSEVPDDLGQWRGYGGGECGYAIVFSPAELLTAIQHRRPGTLMIPLNYTETVHISLIDDLISYTERAYLLQEAQEPDKKRWAVELVTALAGELNLLPAMVKHPKFMYEQERRLATFFGPNEQAKLIFRQKRTLLSRHLPVDLTKADGLLPITKVVVGPGPVQQVSKVSVGDLLLKAGYKGIPVELSVVPYRVP